MKIRKLTMAIAASSLIGLGLSGQAAASVYATSALNIDDLTIAIFDNEGAVATTGVTINSFAFTLTNTATLNGTLAGGVASCNQSGGCGSGTALALDGPVANGPLSDITRINNQTSGSDNTLTVFPIGGGNWANSDSVIYTSQLTHPGSATDTDQIAQANIDTALQASSNTEIQSITGFTFSFSVTAPGPFSLSLSFDADPDMRAEILNDGPGATAQAEVAASFELSNDNVSFTGSTWAPNGAVDQNCFASGGVTCVEIADFEDLNTSVGTTTNNTADNFSWGPNVLGLGSYGIFVDGLTAGDWSLTLKSVTSTAVTRAVPEPGVLGLLGIAIAGLGFARRRKARMI